MNSERENVLALMGLGDLSGEQAKEKLSARVRLTVGAGQAATALAHDITDLLNRSLTITDSLDCDLEIAIGSSFQSAAMHKMHLALSAEALTITGDGAGGIDDQTPGIFRKIAACYAAGNAIARVVGGDRFQYLPSPFIVTFANLGVSPADLAKPIQLDDPVLVGAGGVGNGFMWALAELPVSGRLTICDPKNIGGGNLNRCLYFAESEVGQKKAEVLASKTGRLGFEVVPFPGPFDDLLKQRTRIKRVITTVDSRPARRAIQSGLPIEVLDASTTDLSAVVAHSHRQPTQGACLSCIYSHIPVEDQHQKHVAEGLGLTEAEVKGAFISEDVAEKLKANHPSLAGEDLVGKALDTVYKEQCGNGVLLTPTGKQTVAPLAFISNLAGAFLALELVRFELKKSPIGQSNYMTLDPWMPPHALARRPRARNSDCEFCSKPLTRQVMAAVWPEVDWPKE